MTTLSAVAEYIAKESPIHRLHPLTKLFWSLTVVTASFIFQTPWGQVAILLSILLVALVGRVFRELIPAFMGLVIVAGMFILFQIFFIAEGKTLFALIPGTRFLRVTDEGLWFCLGMAGRMIVITASFPVLMATTQIKDLVVALVNSLKIPYAYAFMFVTTLRFIPTFLGEMDQILQAQRSRGYVTEGRNPLRKMASLGPLAVPLLISSVRKAQRLAVSMETRGFGAGIRSHLHEIRFGLADGIAVTVVLFSAAIAVLLKVKGFLV